MNPRFFDIPLNNSYQKKGPEVRVFMHEYTHPGEREELLKKQKISSSFDMRYRGLIHYYGDDLIAYKLKKGSGKHANEFLRIFSNYLTDYLEDDCPPSWQDCQPNFWKELLYAHYPIKLTISKKQRVTDIFLLQLKRFVRWLDQRTGTSSYPLVEQYSEEALPELKTCEKLLNHLFLKAYPNIHKPDWNIKDDLYSDDDEINECSDLERGMYQVKTVIKDVITLRDLHTERDYQVYGLPADKIQIGILLQGVIGKREYDLLWKWYLTEGVYPSKAKDFSKFHVHSLEYSV